MRLVLKNDWDVPIQSPSYKAVTKEGHFVGRKKETDAILNEIIRKKHGSILISGYRGVGKTSTVNKIVTEAQKSDKKIIPVLLNSSQLVDIDKFGGTGNTVEPNIIIKNLIRRVYKTTIDLSDIPKNIKLKISEIYKKAVSSEVKITESRSNTDTLETEEKQSNFFTIAFDITNFLLYMSWVLSILFLTNRFNFSKEFEWLSNLLGIFFLFLGPSAKISIENSKLKNKKTIAETQANEFYSYDATVGNLLFDLEEIHRMLSNEKFKTVYIIDELDKIEATEVTNILKYFKNFFTLSNALFVFVGCESIWLKSKEQGNPTEHRSPIYTYFNSKYFLARPLWQELSDLIDEIINKEKSKFTEKELLIFKQVVFYESKNDFFDLITKIKDKITSYDDGVSIIEIKDFDFEELLKAKLYKVLNGVYEQKYISYSHSKWEENEKLVKVLFKEAEDIRTKNGMNFTDKDGQDITEYAINDLYNIIYRLKGFNIFQENDKQINATTTKKVRTYKFVGDIPDEPADSIKDLSSIELAYINTFETYMNYIVSIYNVFAEFTSTDKVTLEQFKKNRVNVLEQMVFFELNIKNLVDDHYKLYSSLITQNPPMTHKREDIEAKTETAKKLIDNLKSSFASLNFAVMIRKAFPKYDLQQSNLSANTNLFAGNAMEIRNNILRIPNIIVYLKDYTKQVMILYGRVDVLKAIKKNIGENSQGCRIITVLEKDDELKSRALYKIVVETPNTLFDTCVSALRKIDSFWKSVEEEDKEKQEN